VLITTNKTDRHDITEILLKVALNTIKQTNKPKFYEYTLSLNYKMNFGIKFLSNLLKISVVFVVYSTVSSSR
jgi:hypothetical protein